MCCSHAHRSPSERIEAPALFLESPREDIEVGETFSVVLRIQNPNDSRIYIEEPRTFGRDSFWLVARGAECTVEITPGHFDAPVENQRAFIKAVSAGGSIQVSLPAINDLFGLENMLLHHPGVYQVEARWISRERATSLSHCKPGLEVAQPALESGSTEENPSDAVFLEASFLPGFFGKAWTIKIYHDGRVEKSRTGRVSWSRLAATEVEELRKRVEDLRFFELGELHYDLEEDVQEFSLRVEAQGRRHRVRVWGPERRVCTFEVSRFLKLWNEVLGKVPPPEPCDTTRCQVRCSD